MMTIMLNVILFLILHLFRMHLKLKTKSYNHTIFCDVFDYCCYFAFTLQLLLASVIRSTLGSLSLGSIHVFVSVFVVVVKSKFFQIKFVLSLKKWITFYALAIENDEARRDKWSERDSEKTQKISFPLHSIALSL